jgi:hypothetical protein
MTPDESVLLDLLKWARGFVPEHDSYFHNPYIGEHLRCDVCQKRNLIDKILKGDKR